MKTAVSVPDDVYARAEEAAERLGWNRSQLYTEAIQRYLLHLGPDPVTERLNEIADVAAGEIIAPVSSVAARRLIDSGRWEW